jgi:alkylation response protein AidB-like acyl-CoA dehydrogenase
VLAANTLLHSGDDAAKGAHLPGIASGETIATLAFTEENGRWDESGITATATASGDGPGSSTARRCSCSTATPPT